MALSSLVLVLTISSSALMLGLPCTAAAGGLRIALFHRESQHSPFFNASRGQCERTRAAVRRSNARISHLHSLSRSAKPDSMRSDHSAASRLSISTNLIPAEQEYLMFLSLGTPPVDILAYPDTGSDLIWTHCKPCRRCHQQDSPMFDPRASSTYKNMTCHSDACAEIEGTCGRRRKCRYRYEYADESFTGGVLASETFTFDSPTKGDKISVPGISFGCSHRSRGLFSNSSAGVVGLSPGLTSLVHQLHPAIQGKFSYCLVPPTELNASSNLNIGERAVVAGPSAVTTPILSDIGPYDYYVSLDEITVGDRKIPVRKSSDMDDQSAVILIDSGTTLTYLRPDVLDALKSAISEHVHLETAEDPKGEFELCYWFRGPDDEAAIPDIVFGFTGASVTLRGSSTFVPIEDGARCFGMLSFQETDGDAIFGSWSQQNLHIGFDLEEHVISFAPAECSKL